MTDYPPSVTLSLSKGGTDMSSVIGSLPKCGTVTGCAKHTPSSPVCPRQVAKEEYPQRSKGEVVDHRRAYSEKHINAAVASPAQRPRGRIRSIAAKHGHTGTCITTTNTSVFSKPHTLAA